MLFRSFWNYFEICRNTYERSGSGYPARFPVKRAFLVCAFISNNMLPIPICTTKMLWLALNMENHSIIPSRNPWLFASRQLLQVLLILRCMDYSYLNPLTSILYQNTYHYHLHCNTGVDYAVNQRYNIHDIWNYIIFYQARIFRKEKITMLPRS